MCVVKGLKLKVKKVWGPIHMFVLVTGENWYRGGRGAFFPFPSPFWIGLRAELVAKLVILGILPSISFILTLCFIIFLSNNITSLSLLKSIGTGFNLSASKSDNLSISNSSTSDFKLAKSSALANCDVSQLLHILKPGSSLWH